MPGLMILARTLVMPGVPVPVMRQTEGLSMEVQGETCEKKGGDMETLAQQAEIKGDFRSKKDRGQLTTLD